MKKLLVILFVNLTMYGQDPQTNHPKAFYPILDEYIKEGFERNYRRHTRILGQIDYVAFEDFNELTVYGYRDYVDSIETFQVLVYRDRILNHYRYVIIIHPKWDSNYYVLRRMIFKSLGMAQGLGECHSECTHIMSSRDIFDETLSNYDEVSSNWQEMLNVYYYRVINNPSTEGLSFTPSVQH
jgi:hypothetical protein